MTDDLATLLAECLTDIEQGDLTLEQCLARYPQQRAELEPLLRAALQLSQAHTLEPSRAFQAQARARLLARLPADPSKVPPLTERKSVTTREPYRSTWVRLKTMLTGGQPMSSKTKSSENRRGPLMGCAAGFALVLMLGLCGGGAAWYGAGYQRPALGPVVNIIQPQTGSVAELNRPLPVQASAELSEGMRRVELYADGALVAAQNTTLPAGSNPLFLMQSYTPLTTGRHVLLARAYMSDGQFKDSQVVVVDVVPLAQTHYNVSIDAIQRGPGAAQPSLNDISQTSGIPVDGLIALNPDLGGADPAAPLPPGTRLDLPRTPAPAPTVAAPTPEPPPPGLPSAPIAPTGFSVNADCTSAQLNWTDTNTDETGYDIYRLDPGHTRLTRVTTLPANTVSYHDPLRDFGEYHYQVATVRGGAEALSLLQTAAMPGTCVPPAIAPPTIVLTMRSLHTREAFGGVYCYFSINGSAYERAPASDFQYFASDSDGLTYNLASQLPNHGQFVIPIPPAGEPVTFAGNCSGRSGGEVIPLGSFSDSHTPAEWDGRNLNITALNLGSHVLATLAPALSIDYRLSADTPVTRHDALGDGLGFDPSTEFLQPITPEILYGPWPPDPGTPGALPAPTDLRLENTISEACHDLTGVDAGRCALGGILVGGFPTLLWDWQGDGHYFSDTSLDGYFVQATAPGRPGSFWDLDVTPGSHKFALPPVLSTFPCNTRVTFTVVARQGPYTSTQSNALTLTTPACPPQTQALVAITVESLTLAPDPAAGRFEDVNGDFCFLCTDQRLELSGSLMADNWVLQTTSWGGNIFAPCPALALCVSPGTIDLTDAGLVLLDARDDRSGVVSGLHTNDILAVVNGTESLPISYGFSELDDNGSVTSNVSGCAARLELPARSHTDWVHLDAHFSMVGGGGTPEGICTVAIHVGGSEIPAP
jgi:Bacterial Ig domain